MRKIVKESIALLINEAPITKSYNEAMTYEGMEKLIKKILITFQREGGKNISSMSAWLRSNNIGEYQTDKWVKAAVDTLFKFNSGIWLPINQNLRLSELTEAAMNYWSKKFKHT
jgi:hypothetical protein